MATSVFDGKIEIGAGAPPASLQPPIVGFLYIDYTKPTIYACTNNTKGKVTWKHLDQDEYANLNTKINNLVTLVNSYKKELENYKNGRW